MQLQLRRTDSLSKGCFSPTLFLSFRRDSALERIFVARSYRRSYTLHFARRFPRTTLKSVRDRRLYSFSIFVAARSSVDGQYFVWRLAARHHQREFTSNRPHVVRHLASAVRRGRRFCIMERQRTKAPWRLCASVTHDRPPNTL